MPVANLLSSIPLAFVAFGLLFLGLGVSTILKDRRRRERWQAHTGRVVGSRLDDGKIQCRVAYSRDGREYTFWNRFSATMMTDPIGREVELLVNPDDPNDAVVSRGLVGGSVVGPAFVLFGVVATAVGFWWLR